MADIVIISRATEHFPHVHHLQTAHLKCFELFLKKNPTRHVTKTRTIHNYGEAECIFHEGREIVKPYVSLDFLDRRR